MEIATSQPGEGQPSYEAAYHTEVHGHLLDSSVYYDLRAEQAHRDLFEGATDPGMRVFEFGIGLGKNVVRLPNREGFDVSAFARSHCRSRGILVYEDLAEVPRGAYDRVLVAHVLEHVEDPAGVLRQLRVLLREGGRLIIVLPVESNRSRATDPDVHQHLFSWNFQTLANLLHRTGYAVEHNRFRYGTLHYRLRHVGRVHYPSYDLLVRGSGRILRRREMITEAAPVGLASDEQ